jgi:hypothetical protein
MSQDWYRCQIDLIGVFRLVTGTRIAQQNHGDLDLPLGVIVSLL